MTSDVIANNDTGRGTLRNEGSIIEGTLTAGTTHRTIDKVA